MGCDTSKSARAPSAIKRVKPMQQPLLLVKTESEPTRSSNTFLNDNDNTIKKSLTLRLRNLNASLKVRPPLTALPAFTVGAIVLSYLGYEDEILKLLGQLNNNTRLYKVAHAQQLKPFLCEYRKEITGQLDFAADIARSIPKKSERSENIKQWPSQEILEGMPRYGNTTLTKINYKINQYDLMCGLQLEFSNGYSSPMFETAESYKSNQEVKTININPARTIGQVTMSLYHGTVPIGFQLIDDLGDHIMYEFWTNKRGGHFVTQDIPKGYQIIGLKCNTGTKDQTYLDNISFLLCKCPKPMTTSPKPPKLKQKRILPRAGMSALDIALDVVDSGSEIDEELPLSSTLPNPLLTMKTMKLEKSKFALIHSNSNSQFTDSRVSESFH